jgi:hypothetical protein
MALSILLLVAVDCGTIAAAPAYGNFQSNEVIIRSGAVGGRHRPAVPTAAVAVFPAAEMQAYRSADAPNGYYQVRIPAIVLAGRTLIAMGECARCQPGCKAAIGWSADLCSKISTDGGRTFPSATFQVIAVNGSQPDLVYDREHKQAVLNFCRDRTGDWPKGGLNMQIQSTDGVSWSAPRQLPLSLGLRSAESGPGIGLQLSHGSHAGRLLFSGWRSQTLGAVPGEVVWYSDDGGQTYHAAPSFPGGGAEATMAENANGTVIVIFRINGDQSTKGRLVATSTDGGSSFSNATFDADLRSVACQASILCTHDSCMHAASYVLHPHSHTNIHWAYVYRSAMVLCLRSGSMPCSCKCR